MILDPQLFEVVNCPLCGGNLVAEIYPNTLPAKFVLDAGSFACTSDCYGEHPPIVQCAECRFIFSRYQVRARVLTKKYAEVIDQSYLQEVEGRRRTFGREILRLKRTAPPPCRLLDIGCYTGMFLKVARTHSYEAIGIDLSRWALGIARSDGHLVTAGIIERLPFQKETFDCVTLWDVIEHLADPRRALAEINRVLRRGGTLALTTHNVESLSARLLGSRYPFLMMMHTCHFSKRTLYRMLEETGFGETRIFPHVRILKLGYLAARLDNLSKTLKIAVDRFLDITKLGDCCVSVRGAGLITAIARRTN